MRRKNTASINPANYSADPMRIATWRQPANAILMKLISHRFQRGRGERGTLFLSLMESDVQPSATYNVSANKVVGQSRHRAGERIQRQATTAWT